MLFGQLSWMKCGHRIPGQPLRAYPDSLGLRETRTMRMVMGVMISTVVTVHTRQKRPAQTRRPAVTTPRRWTQHVGGLRRCNTKKTNSKAGQRRRMCKGLRHQGPPLVAAGMPSEMAVALPAIRKPSSSPRHQAPDQAQRWKRESSQPTMTPQLLNVLPKPPIMGLTRPIGVPAAPMLQTQQRRKRQKIPVRR